MQTPPPPFCAGPGGSPSSENLHPTHLPRNAPSATDLPLQLLPCALGLAERRRGYIVSSRELHEPGPRRVKGEAANQRLARRRDGTLPGRACEAREPGLQLQEEAGRSAVQGCGSGAELGAGLMEEPELYGIEDEFDQQFADELEVLAEMEGGWRCVCVQNQLLVCL